MKNNIVIFILLIGNCHSIQTGDFSFFESAQEKKIEQIQQSSLFESQTKLTLEQKKQKILQDYDKKVKEINQKVQQYSYRYLNLFQIKYTNSCKINEEENQEFKKEIKNNEFIKQCDKGNNSAKSFVYSNLHIMLKQINKLKIQRKFKTYKLFNSFSQCYFKKIDYSHIKIQKSKQKTLEYLKRDKQINMFQFCFNNSLQYYIQEIQTLIYKKSKYYQLETIDMYKMESEIFSFQLNFIQSNINQLFEDSSFIMSFNSSNSLSKSSNQFVQSSYQSILL